MVNFKSFQNAVNPESNESTGIVEELKEECDCCGSLSYATRIKGFIACFALGVVLSILSYVMVFLHKFVLFGVFYTMGTSAAFGSSFFLVGPKKQVKNMFAEKRLIATIIVLVMMALTLCAALWWKKGGLVIVFAVFQFLAMGWYALSYIPFARDAVKSCFKSCV